jgi:trimeric autotransporter adhesin
MRRFLTLVCLLFLAIPAGITITGCYRNPAGNYCNGSGYGPKITDIYTITLQPQHTGISLAFGQTRQINAPQAQSCKGSTVTAVGGYSYGTTNNQLVDISPGGTLCAGTWNRNSGGGIADFTICNPPSPIPSTGGLPYNTAFITASANSVTSNPVEVFVHAAVTSISLVGPSQCLSQTETAQLDAQACYSSNGRQVLICAPPTVSSANYVCPLPAGVTSVPSCTNSIGTLAYNAGTSSVATVNPETNQITAEQRGTTVITASLAGSGSSAGYFSTCPPASISVTLNGKTSSTVTQGVPQNLVTNVTDTKGHLITGMTLDYQSTNPLNVGATGTGQVVPSFPGSASLYAVCQPGSCNPSPINQVGVNGTGLSISSNPVNVTVPGTASSFAWYGAPHQSQYFVPVELLSGTVGSTVRLPFVPNSMVMDQTGTNLYFGSSHELMVYSTANSGKVSENPSVPGVVLAVSPLNQQLLINDQIRQVFYLVDTRGTIAATFGGLGTAAQWTPDGKTLYVTDSAAANVNGVTGHTNTLYVYNASTGWTVYSLATSGGTSGPENLVVSVPGVGAFISGNPTVAHTWCPTGTPGDYASMKFYPEGASVSTNTEVLAATKDGKHILGAAATGSGISLSDIGVTIPTGDCPAPVGGVLQPLTIPATPLETTVAANASSVNAVVTSPAPVSQGANTAASSLSFVLYNGNTPGATLPFYSQATADTSSLGNVGYVTFTGGSTITAPIAGAFSPDNTLFFVSTAGDNKVQYIDTTTLTDKQQISPNLPACAPGSDPDCTIKAPAPTVVPATAIWVKPRSTT